LYSINKGGAWWLVPVIPATGEAEMRKIVILGQHMQKVSKTPISTNKLGMVGCICNPSYREA
jgi:hypothetical protein